MKAQRPRAAFVSVTYAGWRTRSANLKRSVEADARLDSEFHTVSGWRDGGLFERMPLPRGVAGRLRALTEARALASMPRPDIVWTSCSELALPYLWAFAGPLARPLVIETDWTLAQQEELAPLYFGRPSRTGAALAAAKLQERITFSRADLIITMSRWAADGVEETGVPAKRVRVIPPGLDLDAWDAPLRPVAEDRPLRLLFVGNDIKRKGADLVIDAVHGPLAGRCELDVVTRDELAASPGVRVHRANTNSPELRALFAAADLFVLPTRAECFGQVFVEALASGLPAIAGRVGGTSDIIDPGETGWLIEPRREDVVMALENALTVRDQLPAMGRRARAVAEKRFDGRRNDRLIVDLMLEIVERRRAARRPAA